MGSWQYLIPDLVLKVYKGIIVVGAILAIVIAIRLNFFYISRFIY
jgi:hypothetical protein